jgi:5-methylcytosine-specific restriction endonuclease McrA
MWYQEKDAEWTWKHLVGKNNPNPYPESSSPCESALAESHVVNRGDRRNCRHVWHATSRVAELVWYISLVAARSRGGWEIEPVFASAFGLCLGWERRVCRCGSPLEGHLQFRGVIPSRLLPIRRHGMLFTARYPFCPSLTGFQVTFCSNDKWENSRLSEPQEFSAVWPATCIYTACCKWTWSGLKFSFADFWQFSLSPLVDQAL